MSQLEWSPEITFSKDMIKNQVPQMPGVYEILQSKPYSRYKGSTRVLKIGISLSDLQTEILNHFIRHTAANRLSRIRNDANIIVTVIYIEGEANQVKIIESTLLREFEVEFWDLPVLNSTRGFSRGEDISFR